MGHAKSQNVSRKVAKWVAQTIRRSMGPTKPQQVSSVIRNLQQNIRNYKKIEFLTFFAFKNVIQMQKENFISVDKFF